MTRNHVGDIALEAMDAMGEFPPEADVEVVAAGIVVEVKYTCPNCDERHTMVISRASTDSEVHAQALFEEGAECGDLGWDAMAIASDDEE